MTSLRIAWTELRRITTGRLPKIAVLAMVLIPTLYAGLYLYANHDPYANLDHVPAALVVQDSGSTDQDGNDVNTGRTVADDLLERHDFDWNEVSAAEAEKGVEEGRYDFALRIPTDFSTSLTSVSTQDPEQARLQLVTNDANSYLSTTIADTVVGKVRDSIATEVSEEAATTFLLGIADLRSGLVRGGNGAQELVKGLYQADQGAAKLAEGAGTLESGAGDLHDGADELTQGLDTLESNVASLPADTRTLADGARKVANGDATIADYGNRAANAVQSVTDVYGEGRTDLKQLLEDQDVPPGQQQRIMAIYDRAGKPIRQAGNKAQQVKRKLNRLAAGSDAVADGAEKLANATPALVKGIGDAHAGADRLTDGAQRLETGAGDLHEGATELEEGLDELGAGAKKLRNGLRNGARQVPATDKDTRNQIASTIGDPVDVRSSSKAEAGSYGAGLAPFFLGLSAWIGGYVLFLLVRPLSQRALAANQSSLRVALGGWYPPMLIGAFQMACAMAVLTLALDIEPANVVTTLAFLLLTSATFIAIVHALNAWLGTPGQFLGLVMLVTQLVTAGGTFPWQTIPQPLYWLHHVLPMSYAVDGLRQLMYGGLQARVLTDVGVLGLWLVLALLATSWAARRQRVWSAKRVRPELVL